MTLEVMSVRILPSDLRPQRALLPSQPKPAILDEEVQIIDRHIPSSAEAFPDDLKACLKFSLQSSLKRVKEGGLEQGLHPEEQSKTLKMLGELTEGLQDLSSGQAAVVRATKYSDNVSIWTVRAPDKDEFVITTRKRADERGQARIAIKQTKDDGVRLPKAEQMHLRLDLSQEFGAAIDVQFGLGELDGKVHGFERDEQGEIIISKFNYPVTKHHFEKGLPADIEQEERFASVVDKFVKETMETLPTRRRSSYSWAY